MHTAHWLLAATTLALPATTDAQPHVLPPEPINNAIDYDHTYTPSQLLQQLRDDDIRRNLSSALDALMTHPDLTPAFLYTALNHEDWQVRQVICREIWLRITNQSASHPLYTITPDLIRITIEGLKDDTTPIDQPRRRGLIYYNAIFGVQHLIPIAHDWIRELEGAMESEDAQQQLLAAYILARAGVAQSVERASQILLPHLRDNDLREDAKFCVYALGGFGPELLPHLRDALATADQQQKDLISLLIMDIMDPPYTQKQRDQRAVYNTITQTVTNPAMEHPHAALWSWLSDLNQ